MTCGSLTRVSSTQRVVKISRKITRFISETSEWWSARVSGPPPSQRCGHSTTILDLSTVNAPLPPNNVSLLVFGGFERTNICHDLHIMVLGTWNRSPSYMIARLTLHADLNSKEVKWLPGELSPHIAGVKFYRADTFQIMLREDWKTPTPRYGHTMSTYQVSF